MLGLTYPQFHVVFVLPALAALLILAVVDENRDEQLAKPLPVAVVTLIALVYTIPWDNYLIHRDVWWYGEGRVAAVIWNAPVSEYLFILLVPPLGALWLDQFATRFQKPTYQGQITLTQRLTGAVCGAVICGAGVVFFFNEATLYLGSILAWSGPVLALQWGVGWPYLWARRRLVGGAILVPTLYLSVVDRIAIGDKIWQISSEKTTGLTLGGLPIEEGLFFFVTSTFIVQGLVLYPWVRDRWR